MSKYTHVVVALALLLLTAGAAHAADGEVRWGDFGWRVLNIIIFVAILWKFTGKLIVNFLTGRREGIKNELDSLEQRRVDAKAKLAKVEQSIAHMDTERKAILDESRVQAEAVKQTILSEAARQAEQILEQARRTAENEGRAMLVRVRSQIADDIVDAAEKVLLSKLDVAQHATLIDNSLTKVVLH